nr:putative reverse transcriptase domain-containing protein [Tanacetum cinerariifolium]
MGDTFPMACNLPWKVVPVYGKAMSLSMLLVDFKNAFNIVDMNVLLEEIRVRFPSISLWVEFCYARPARFYYDDYILWSCQGVQQGDPLGPLLFSLALHPLDPRSRAGGVFPINISCPLNDVKLLGDSVSLDEGFSRELALKRVSKTIPLMEAIHKLRDPQSGDIIWNAFLASRLQTSALQAKILMKSDIESQCSSFKHAHDALHTTCNVYVLFVTTSTFAPLMMKTLEKCYFCVIEKDLVSM